MNLLQILFSFLIAQLWQKVSVGMRTCTVIAPEFIHSGRKYSISLATNKVNSSSQFEVIIESTNFKESRVVELQPNGLQIVEFDLPFLPPDEYVLSVKGEDGIYVQQSTLLKYAAYKPLFFIQTNKFIYRSGETLHYRIICMDEVFRPKIPVGHIDVKIMTQDHRIIHHKKSAKLEHFIIRGELYLKTFQLTSIKPRPHFVARLTVSVNSEVLAAVNFQIENEKWDSKTTENNSTEYCTPKEIEHKIFNRIAKNNADSSEMFFRVQLQNEGHQNILAQDDVASFKVLSHTPFQFLVYTIIGRGNIVQSERIQLLKEAKEYHLHFKPINQMAPLSKLIVYFIDVSNYLYYDELMFNVEVKLENLISLSTHIPVMPNKKFALNITTGTNAYVGILAIEEKTEDRLCANDHNEDYRLQYLLQHFGGHSLQRGEITGTHILTSAELNHKPKKFYKNIGLEEDNDPFQMRMESWQKTWIFAEISNTTSNNFIIPHNLPNEASNWRITVFAINSEAGLGYTQLNSSIQTKKSYNISFNLPHFIYESEIFNLPIRIDNILDEEIDVRVEFLQENFDIELMQILTDGTNSVQTIGVPRKSHAQLKYTFRSRKSGVKALKFYFSSLAGDYWQNIEIVVKAKGATLIENYSILIDLKNASTFSKEISADENYNQDTKTMYPTLTAFGNLMEPYLEFLSKPYETQTAQQASSMMALSCLSLKYLKRQNRNNIALETKILQNMHASLMSVLDFRDFDKGYFKYFSHTESTSGSSWLTAYIATWLPCVKKYVNVDETVIEMALDYLAGTQTSDGSFYEKGIIINSVSGNNTLAITSHILIALLENEKYYTVYKSVLEKGIKYIVENLHRTECLYAKALGVYALYKAGFQDLHKELQSFDESAHIHEGYKFWSQGSEYDITNVASTAFVLLTALGVSSDFEKSYKPAIKWLIEQGAVYKFENRGLYPTFAEVLSVEIFTRLMQITDEPTKADVTITYRDLFRVQNKEFELNEKLSEKQALTLDNFIGGLRVSAVGQGFGLALVKFNTQVLKPFHDPQFEIFIHKPSYNSFVSFTLKVCIKYEGPKKYADLTILEVNAPSGYAIDADHLLRIVEKKFFVKHATMNDLGSEMKFYFVGLQRDEFECISIEMFRVHAIVSQAPAPVLCYEYTDVSKMGVAYFTIEGSICDLCEGSSDCNKNCYSHK